MSTEKEVSEGLGTAGIAVDGIILHQVGVGEDVKSGVGVTVDVDEVVGIGSDVCSPKQLDSNNPMSKHKTRRFIFQ